MKALSQIAAFVISGVFGSTWNSLLVMTQAQQQILAVVSLSMMVVITILATIAEKNKAKDSGKRVASSSKTAKRNKGKKRK